VVDNVQNLGGWGFQVPPCQMRKESKKRKAGRLDNQPADESKGPESRHNKQAASGSLNTRQAAEHGRGGGTPLDLTTECGVAGEEGLA